MSGLKTEEMADSGVREDSTEQTRAPRLDPVGDGEMTKGPCFWTKVSEAIEAYRDEE